MPERNQIIDDLRGICMLGVIGIHVGSFVLEAPYPNSFLIYAAGNTFHAIVFPRSFFISGYGLFCQYRPETTIAYLPFLKNGCKVSDFPMLSGHCFICFTFLLLCQDV